MKSPAVFLLVTLLAFCGCDSSPKRVPVVGNVTVKGKPAEGAILMFFPSDPQIAIASAVAEADGTFKVFSDSEPGLVVGKYQVTISWPDPSKKPTQAQLMMGTAEAGPDLLKGKYSSQTSTTLSAEITSTSKQLPPFEL